MHCENGFGSLFARLFREDGVRLRLLDRLGDLDAGDLIDWKLVCAIHCEGES